MKCFDKQYIAVPAEHACPYMFDFNDVESMKTKTDYTLINIGTCPDTFDKYDRMVLMWMETPNALIHTDPNNLGHFSQILRREDKFIKIYCQCPYTAEYFNQTNNYDKFEHMFVPFNTKYVPPPQEKVFDVYYTGHLGNVKTAIDFTFPFIRSLNHCIVAGEYGTHFNTSYAEKLILNAQSKISIVHNLLVWPDPNTGDRYPGHGAFYLIRERGIAPQIKTRVLEAAASKSLILCYRDPWNLIEQYFEPDVHFIYWNDLADLQNKVQYIITHYDEYTPMIEAAYNELVSTFNLQIFFDRYLKNL